MNDMDTDDTEIVLLKDNNHGEGHVATIVKENVRIPQRMKTHVANEHQPSDAEPAQPAKAGRRPWVWALFGLAGAVGIGVGVSYYLYSLSYESTDDAFVDGHIVAVSPRGGPRGERLRDRQPVGQARRTARGTRLPRLRGPSRGGGGGIIGRSSRPQVALHRGRCHGNHLGRPSERGLSRRGGRRASIETAEAAEAPLPCIDVAVRTGRRQRKWIMDKEYLNRESLVAGL